MSVIDVCVLGLDARQVLLSQIHLLHNGLILSDIMPLSKLSILCVILKADHPLFGWPINCVILNHF